MILICDNAPYHHCRDIGNLGGKSKKDLVDLCIKHDIQYIDLPHNKARLAAVSDVDVDCDLLEGVEYYDDYCRVAFDDVLFAERGGNNGKPFIPTTEELRLGIMNYIKDKKPELLECKVENHLKENGDHKVLWTPPYCPDLQPIELFWAAGKNHARNFSSQDTTMKETINNVREGWYGNIKQWDSGDVDTTDYRRYRKDPVDCFKLFEKMVEMANTKFIPICKGISGCLGELTIDDSHEPIREGVPIDVLMLSVSKCPKKLEEHDL